MSDARAISPGDGDDAVGARSVHDYVSLLRRRRLALLTCLTLAMIATAAYLLLAPPTYESSAKVRVFATSGDVDAEDARIIGEINLDTEAQLVKSEQVAQLAADELETDVALPSLLRDVSVTVPANTTVLQITYAADTAEEARAGAQAFAEAYLVDRKDTAEALVAGQGPEVEAQIDAGNQRAEDLREQLDDVTLTDEERADLQARLTSLEQRLSDLDGRLSVINAVDVDPGRVINDAVLPSTPSSPDPVLAAPSGVMAGLILGVGVAFWRDNRDRYVHDSAEVSRLYGLTPVSTLPKEWSGGGRGRRAPDKHDVILLQHAALASPGSGSTVVLVVSAGGRQLAAQVAQALAVLTAAGGDTTALLTQFQDLTIADEQAGPLVDHHVLSLTDYSDTDILHDGDVRPRPVMETIRTLRQKAEVVIVEVPSDDPAVDGPVFARQANAVIVVIEYGRTERDRLREIIAAVGLGGARRVLVAPVAWNKARSRRRWFGMRRPATP